MGVLEDAIREHLALRRKQGVGDDELRRQEDEALGPARSGAPVAEAESNEAEPAAETALLDSDHVSEAPPPREPAEPGLSESAPAGMAQEAPPESEAVEAVPVEEAPVEEAPVEEAPVEEAPVEEAPVEDAPIIPPEPSPADFAEEPPEQDGLPREERPRRDLDFD